MDWASEDRPVTRRRYLAVTILAAIGVAAASAVETPKKLIWNATASAPVGFYTVEPVGRIEVPDLVAVMPPEPLAAFMVQRGYIARGVPLLKRVAGLPGQRVCRAGRTITVDRIEMAEALERDRIGRELPVWQGCRVIAPGELFLMNWEVRDSLDSRYFGPIPASSVIGRAVPLWTDEDGVGRYEWRAPTH
jgi:conjugative transfer signal peptidase TraF